MAKVVISKRVVDAAVASGKDVILWDEKLAGFGLKVTPSGRKVYLYRYRFSRPGQAARTAPTKYTIGPHGDITPDQARKRAQDLAALVANGVDPRQHEADLRAAQDRAKREADEQSRRETELAFSRMADIWLKYYEHERARRPSSVAQAKLVVENHLKPAFGNRPMPHIGRSDLQAVIDRIPLKQKAMRRTVFAYSSVLFGWAAKRDAIPRNPLFDMTKPPAPPARDRVLSDEEVARVWAAAAKLKKPWGPFYRIAILTGQRRDEVAKLHWSELDRAKATWTIPAARAKNGMAHIVPLSKPLVDELDALAPSVKGSDKLPPKWPKTGFVLTTNRRSAVSGFSKAKKLLDAAIEAERNIETNRGRYIQPQTPWRVHDLRRTVATGLQRLGVRFEVTEAVLNHVSGAKGGVAGVYQRHDWALEKRAALDAWAEFVGQLVTGSCEDDAAHSEAGA